MGDSGENATSFIAATTNKDAKKTEMGWRSQPGMLCLNVSRVARHWAHQAGELLHRSCRGKSGNETQHPHMTPQSPRHFSKETQNNLKVLGFSSARGQDPL